MNKLEQLVKELQEPLFGLPFMLPTYVFVCIILLGCTASVIKMIADRTG